MKKTFLLALAIIAVLYGCDSINKENKAGYTIKADIDGLADSTLITLNLVRDGDLKTVDSAFVTNSHVDFEGTLENPEMIYLKIGNTRKMINVFGENSQIEVKVHVDSLEQAKVSGSKVHDDLMEFSDNLKPLGDKSASLNAAYGEAAASGNEELMKEIVAQYDALRVEQLEKIKEFVANKPASYISPFIIKSYLSYEMDYAELDSVISQLDSSVYDSKDYQSLAEQVSTMKNVAVGMPAVDFALEDSTGNPIAISSFKGKYLLIDFWASWCGPCRRENPNVVALYNDFSDKGFEIIGVSLDEDRQKWIDAIHQDDLTWPHVSDLKGWNSAAGKLYGIKSIPATVLLDRDGVIIAKNLRGDALREKLEELYTAEGGNI